METVTISKIEYKKLKQYSSIFVKIAEKITRVESIYPYDYKYVDILTEQALKDFKKGKCIEAKSVKESLIKFKKKK